jgi:cbb3-type cytochrome oxidase subunit 3
MGTELAYLVFGATLCLLLAAVALLAYRRSHRERVESPKYRMLDDDEG